MVASKIDVEELRDLLVRQGDFGQSVGCRLFAIANRALKALRQVQQRTRRSCFIWSRKVTALTWCDREWSRSCRLQPARQTSLQLCILCSERLQLLFQLGILLSLLLSPETWIDRAMELVLDTSAARLQRGFCDHIAPELCARSVVTHRVLGE